ncbi:hypothetical protein N7508_003690 [Penicillium antarcticum]|uniref:uncharacterized protein n=1 Tax=Penicillium antarcticum TaxID=416450 RepID=UPI0023943CC2|nr:uncharacterized protein N7508_003690 [Penicillium antarcticum]KAJ5312860.1 hypothetical protein N7508_003690 [Penicillium antarcticum]
MTDPFSITAGAVGFLSLGIQVSGNLLEFYSSYKNRDADLAKITDKLEELLGIFKCLDSALKNGLPTTKALSHELDKVVVSCSEIIDELQTRCERFQQEPGSSLKGALHVHGLRVAYPFRKRTLRALEVDIAEMRSNLSLALDVLQLENQKTVGDRIDDLKLLLERTNALQVSSTIHDWLKAPDATVDHNSASAKHHPMTGLWFLESHQFQEWLVTNDSFLWINGFAGSGKSVLMSTTIQHTIRTKQHQFGVGIAFFYFSFGDVSKRTSYSMLSALLLQLSTQNEDGQKDLEQLYQTYNSQKPPLDALLDCLRLCLSRFSQSYLFIDALDESLEGPVREMVLSAIRRMRQWNMPTIHLLVSSRDEVDIRQSLGVSEDQDISIRNSHTDRDILNFVAYELESDPKLRKWHRRHHEIREKLVKQAEGVFIFVACQLSSLRKVLIGNQLDEWLRSLPRDLDETYKRTLCNIEAIYTEDVRRILTALCISDRPLTITELIGAIAVNFSEPPQIDSEGRSYDPNDLFGICGILVEPAVIETYYGQAIVARIAHFSLREYLQSDRMLQQKAKQFGIRQDHANAEMAQTCLVYLSDPNLSVEMSNEMRIAQFPFAKYAAQYWYHHYERTTARRPHLEALALRLFQNKASFAAWVNLHDFDSGMLLVVFERPFHQMPPPIYYSALLGLENVLKALIKASPNQLLRESSLNDNTGHHGCALQAASFEGHESVVQTLLEYGANPNVQGGYSGNALQAASYNGYERIVQMLLEKGADPNIQSENFGGALQTASRRGHKNIVQMFLKRGVEVNAQTALGATALQAASFEGHESVVQILLEHGADRNVGNALQAASRNGHERILRMLLKRDADVNLGTVDSNALLAASLMGHEGCVQLLLEQGANVNVQLGRNGSALVAASSGGFENIVNILLEKGANVNGRGGRGSTALQAALSKGHVKIVQRLLDEGADPNIQGGVFGNALQAASSMGNEKIVEILLEQGVDPSAQGGKYGDALQAASAGGYEGIVQMLLQKAADVDARGGLYGSALQAACLGGYEKIVRVLLKEGANVNARGGEYGNALQAASYRGNESIVQLLLDKGADVNARGGEYGNALQAASYTGNESIVQLLLEKGADVNASGGDFGNALQAASYQAHKNLVHLLLKKGADANAQGGMCGNALQAALYEGFLEVNEIIEMLLTNGADVNAQGGEYGNALQMASHGGYGNIVQMLLDRGANVDAQGGEYGSALRAAFYEGHEDIVEMLLQKGADRSELEDLA